MDETNFENLSKHQRRRLRKQLKEEQAVAEEIKREKAKNLKKIGLYAVAAVVVIGIAFVLFSFFNKPPVGENAELELSSSFFSFGNVSVAGGTVSTTLILSNQGEDALVIEKIEASCMCTSAKLSFNGRESPTFGMHSNSPFWSETIPPGETAELKIFYDPTAHPELRGPVTRIVSIYSNDLSDSKKDIKIEVNQVS